MSNKLTLVKELNGSITVIDTVSGDFINTLSPTLMVRAIREGQLQVYTSKSVEVQSFFKGQIDFTQILPAAPIAAPATIQLLCNFLKDNFFTGIATVAATVSTTGLAKETKQDAEITELQAIKNAILAQASLAVLVYEDAVGVFVIRRETDAGVISFEDITGAPIVPTPPLVPVGHTKSVIQKFYDATALGVGYVAGDILCRLAIFDANLPSFVPVFIWLNFTQGTTITTPTSGTYEAIEENIGARQVGTWNVNTGLAQPLTNTELRATPVPITGTVVANTGLAQPLTNTELRAAPVPVSGTVTANTGLAQPLTNTELRAAPVPITGTVAVTDVNLGAQADTAATTDIGTFSLIAFFKRYLQTFTNFLSRFPAALGQTVKANSLPVTIASDQNPFVVSLATSTYVQSASNTSSTNLGAGLSFVGAIVDILGAPALILSVRTTQATTITVTQYNDLAGTITVETSIFTRVANTPLNTSIKLSGKFVRVSVTNNGLLATTSMLIDTKLGVLETLPSSLTNRGQLKVSIDEVAQTTNAHTSGTITLGGTAQVLLPANLTRKYFEFQNRSATAMILCIGATATATNGIILAGAASGVGGFYSMPANMVATGAISIFCTTTGRAFTYLEA